MTNQGLALVPRAACSPHGEQGAHTKIGEAGRRAPALAPAQLSRVHSRSPGPASLPGWEAMVSRGGAPGAARPPAPCAAFLGRQVVSAPAADGVPGSRSGAQGTLPEPGPPAGAQPRCCGQRGRRGQRPGAWGSACARVREGSTRVRVREGSTRQTPARDRVKGRNL